MVTTAAAMPTAAAPSPVSSIHTHDATETGLGPNRPVPVGKDVDRSTCHNPALTVAALTGRVNSPASRVRIRQYIGRLAADGIEVQDHIPVFATGCGLPSPFKMAARLPGLWRSRPADLVWIIRTLVQGYECFERFLHRPRLMDVDDAIWLNRPFGRWTVPDVARHMDAITVGNNYLADYFHKYCRAVYVVPTCIDLSRYHLRDESAGEPDKFVIGWTGLSSNYRYLEAIEPVLARFLQDHGRATVSLLANKPWQSREIPPDRLTFTAWTAHNEAQALHDYSVGIMPLGDDRWTRGKCSFKMLQYMAVGLPVIVSPVGMNKEVLEQGEIGLGPTTPQGWYEALEALYHDWDLQRRLGAQGRHVVETYYSAEVAAGQLARIIRRTVGG